LKKIPAWKLIFSVIFFFYQVVAPVLVDSAQLFAQNDCVQYIKSAEQNYYAGKFDKAIELIKLCLKQGQISPDIQFKALKILCQAYLAKDYQEAAREVAKKLIDLQPDYMPTIEQEPPPFIVMINEVRAEKGISPAKSTKKVTFFEKHKSLLWIVGGGAALIGLTAVLAAGGNNKKESKPLAHPPDWPDSQ
jgi:tetratricopeptide (TPR) repeat protein